MTKNHGISNDTLRFRNYSLTMVMTPLKHPTPTKHEHITLTICETDHSQRAGSYMTEIRGILNDLRNSNREVGPDTTPVAVNIAAKTLLPHSPINHQHVSLPLPITDHPQ